MKQEKIYLPAIALLATLTLAFGGFLGTTLWNKSEKLEDKTDAMKDDISKVKIDVAVIRERIELVFPKPAPAKMVENK